MYIYIKICLYSYLYTCFHVYIYTYKKQIYIYNLYYGAPYGDIGDAPPALRFGTTVANNLFNNLLNYLRNNLRGAPRGAGASILRVRQEKRVMANVMMNVMRIVMMIDVMSKYIMIECIYMYGNKYNICIYYIIYEFILYNKYLSM